MIRLVAFCFIAFLATPALAQEAADDQAPNEATQEMHESLNQPKPTEDGTKQAPGGEAKPDESWLGCEENGARNEACADQSGDESEK